MEKLVLENEYEIVVPLFGAAFAFLSSTLYALCIETKINFVNQNKGKITLIILQWGRVSLAMS